MQVETDMKKCITSELLKLPSHLICDILSRLTVETIFSCKCVCKTFLEILTDPYFVELHLTKAPNVDDGLILQDRERISDILLVYSNRLDLEKLRSEDAYFNSRPCQTIGVPTLASQFYNKLVSIIGSCNGLLCLYYYGINRDFIYYICNPILGEFFALPYVPFDSYEYSGFGFCPKTKQYKVIRFIKSSVCIIHTVGTDCWRTKDNLPYPRVANSFGCTINGNLHWITDSTTASNLICSFNLETEQHSYISPPANFNQYALRKYSCGEPEDQFLCYSKIGLLDGLLCFSYKIGVRFEVFVMKNYGVEGHWTKEFSIDLRSNFILRNKRLFIVNFLNNGDLFVYYDICNLFRWNLRTGSTRRMLAGEVYQRRAISFVPSFISLKDIAAAAGGHVEFVQRKMGRNLWSHNGFRFIH